jgi:hypothetical protein
MLLVKAIKRLINLHPSIIARLGITGKRLVKRVV